jgi:hypothetical protein
MGRSLASLVGGTLEAVPIATAALVLSALLFAPLSSYVAGRRARSPLVWFGLGVVIGPFALLLLLLAPPGRCLECGTGVRGWPRACDGCGARLVGAIGGGPAVDASEPAATRPAPPATAEQAPPGPVLVRTVGGASPAAPALVTPRPVLVPSPPPVEPPVIILPTATRAGARWQSPRGGSAAAASPESTAARRRYRKEQDHVAPSAQLIGSGIYLGGSAPSGTNVARLDVGDRYGLARDGDELQILGPVTFDPERIVARVPLAGAEVERIADRLVVHGGVAARGLAVAFAGIAVGPGIDPVAILSAPTGQVG